MQTKITCTLKTQRPFLSLWAVTFDSCFNLSYTISPFCSLLMVAIVMIFNSISFSITHQFRKIVHYKKKFHVKPRYTCKGITNNQHHSRLYKIYLQLNSECLLDFDFDQAHSLFFQLIVLLMELFLHIS